MEKTKMRRGGIKKTREFGGKRYGFVRRCFTKFDAEKIVKARRAHGLRARVVEVKARGLEGGAYDVWGAE